MFNNAENVGVRISNLSHRQMEKDEKEIGLVEIEFEINPFTPELAADVHDFIKRTLYTAKDAEVTSLLSGASFNLSMRPQEIAVRMAKDQSDASFIIDEAKIGALHARRSKRSTAWRLVFTATCAPDSEHQLAQIVDCYLKMRYVTMADAQPGLFAEVEKDARKKKAPVVRGQSVTGDGAVAH